MTVVRLQAGWLVARLSHFCRTFTFQKEMVMLVASVDVGYSNVKIATQHKDGREPMAWQVSPAGAGALGKLTASLNGARSLGSGVHRCAGRRGLCGAGGPAQPATARASAARGLPAFDGIPSTSLGASEKIGAQRIGRRPACRDPSPRQGVAATPGDATERDAHDPTRGYGHRGCRERIAAAGWGVAQLPPRARATVAPTCGQWSSMLGSTPWTMWCSTTAS